MSPRASAAWPRERSSRLAGGKPALLRSCRPTPECQREAIDVTGFTPVTGFLTSIVSPELWSELDSGLLSRRDLLYNLGRFHEFGAGMKPVGQRELRKWLLIILPFGAFLALCVSGGGYLQYFALAAFEAAPDLSVGDLPGHPVQLPRLDEWLLESVGWPLLFGVATAFLIFRDVTVRGVFLRSVGGITLVLTIVDIGISVTSSSLSVKTMAENLFANLIAGLIIGWIILCIAWVYEFITKSARGVLQRVGAVVFVIASGFLCTTTLYYVLFFFIQKTPMAYVAKLKPTYSGVFISSQDREEHAFGSPGSALQFAPSDPGKFEATISSYRGQPQYLWQASSAASYRGSISFLTDCWGLDAASSTQWKVHQSDDNIKKLQISLDEGPAYVQSVPIEGTYSFNASAPTFFWVTRNKGARNSNSSLLRTTASFSSLQVTSRYIFG